MKNFDIALEILKNIALNERPFSVALRSAFKKYTLDIEDRRAVTALVGCELRHHLLFQRIISNYFELNEEPKYLGINLALANLIFAKRLDNHECYKFAKEDALMQNQNFPYQKLQDFFDWAGNSQDLIPSEFNKESAEYLSLRFNTPIWIIKMWQKQFGKIIAYKTLKANYKPSVTTLKVNTLVASIDSVLSEPGFHATQVDGIVTFDGKSSGLRKEDLFEKQGLFYEKMATKIIIDSLNLDPYQKVAIFTSFPNNIYLDLASRFSHTFAIEIMTDHLQTYLETKKNIERYCLTNMHVYEMRTNSLVTCLSNKVDVFFVLPKNSSFDLLRSTPDYFLRIKQDQLDGLINNQKKLLAEADENLNVAGRIVYLIPTISNKEGHLVINEFIKNHPNYQVEFEKQFLPFESFDSCLYCAVLRKN